MKNNVRIATECDSVNLIKFDTNVSRDFTTIGVCYIY